MSLRVKVFLPLLLAIVLLAAYLYVLWIPRVLADAESAYRNSVARHLESVAEGMVPLMLGKQLDAVYGNLDALLEKNADWVSIRLFDPQGRLLYPLRASGPAGRKDGPGARTLTQEIRYLDAKLAAMELQVDSTPRLKEISQGSQALIYTLLAVLLLILLANGLILDFMVRKPIRLLADASQRLASGDFDMSLPKPGNDEVGILVTSFAGMRDAVRTHTRRLSEANEQLLQEIAERRQAEDALRRAQEDLVRQEKLSILGQLSGSVGHELRNPLAVMSNALYFLREVHADGDETTKEYLGIIGAEIANSQRIITDLLDFARTRPPRKVAVKTGELVRQSLERCAIPENVTVTVDVPEEASRLNIDPLQMQQVLTNFIANGVQAMPQGGSLHVATRLVPGIEPGNGEREAEIGQVSNAGPSVSHAGPSVSQPESRAPVPEKEAFIEIRVTDTGDGISPENMKKLFQPLFTTKPKGIGLGLVVCKNLAGANGGRIEAESELGKGSSFAVLLPMEGGDW